MCTHTHTHTARKEKFCCHLQATFTYSSVRWLLPLLLPQLLPQPCPSNTRKCLHFCTFLLSHYAKYICIVCCCFSSSFDAYVLPSIAVLRLTLILLCVALTVALSLVSGLCEWVRGGCLGFMVVCFRFWLLRIHVLPSALQTLRRCQRS